MSQTQIYFSAMPTSNSISANNWKKFSELLLALRADGPDGFEGLMAAALEVLTGKPFLVAATGRQPLGDATAIDTRISLQAKRYRPTTVLEPTTVVADFIEAKEAAGGRLDVYVVAVTRESAQLRQRMETFERAMGVDIVILAEKEDEPEVSALCIACWERVKSFFPPADAAWEAWVSAVATNAATIQIIERIRHKIGLGLNTYLHLRDEAREKLAETFRQSTNDNSIVGVRIDLEQSVERSEPQESLQSWWAQAKYPNGRIEAQEGCGKSWVAAAFAEKLMSEPEGPVVLWLQSLEWFGCETIEELVTAALQSVYPSGDPRIEASTGKIFRLWPRPVLIVLDGVNENNCLQAAQVLLHLYGRHATHYASRFRILFTTRPLDAYDDFAAETWRCTARIPLGGFSEPEFAEALRRFAPEVQLASVPANVRMIAAIPRFFRIAVRLRERLRDLGQLNKPLLLFADLADKIERDPQTRKIYGAGTMPPVEEILAHLARNAQPGSGGTLEVSLAHMHECFPSFGAILEDLKEQRVVLGRRSGNVTVGAEHVVLGFALHLLQIASEPDLPEATLRDRLATALEPNREDDLRTEALYVGLLLTLLRDPPGTGTWRPARRVLLTLWCSGHNAVRATARLGFWARTDLSAYQGMTETLFSNYLSGEMDTALVTPIAQRWAATGGQDQETVALVERWLTLIYPGTDQADPVEKARERKLFPAAETYQQLRLSYAALSMLSTRPERSLLEALARSARSCHFCHVTEELNGKPHTHHLKTPYENFGILLRWGYTEAVMNDLVGIAAAAGGNEARLYGVRTLAECLRMVELPKILVWESVRYPWHPPDQSPPTRIRQFKEWVTQLPSAQSHWPGLWDVAFLTEHPDARLEPSEVQRLQTYLTGVLTSSQGREVGRDVVADVFPAVYPWLAAHSPVGAQTIAAHYWGYALRSSNPGGAAMFAPIVPLAAQDRDRLMTEFLGAKARFQASAEMGHILSRFSATVLLSEDEDAILRWFEILLDLPAGIRSEEWHILPVPYMLEIIATTHFAAICWERYERAIAIHGCEADSRAIDYWLSLYACMVRNNAEAGRAALRIVTGLPPGHPQAARFVEIIAAAASGDLIEAALREPKFRHHLETAQGAFSFRWFVRGRRDWRLSAEACAIASELPLAVAVNVLPWTGNDQTHRRFARALADAALRRLAGAPAPGEPGYQMRWHKRSNGSGASWSLDEKDRRSRTHHSPMSAVWGVDRGSADDFAAAFAEVSDDSIGNEHIAKLNDAIGHQRARMEKIADHYLIEFHGRMTLERWAQNAGEEFREFVDAFLAQLRKQTGHYPELAVFCEELLETLCGIDAGAASRLRADFFTPQGGAMRVHGVVPSFVARVMAADLDAQGIVVENLRRSLLNEATSDRELYLIVAAATTGGTLPWLRSFARNELSVSPLAKVRALAVTVFAFGGEEGDLAWLKSCAQTDESSWVRDHATWSLAVHEQTAIAQKLWSEISAEATGENAVVAIIATKLERLRTYLPPMALYWPRPTPKKPVVQALLVKFWFGWENMGGAKGERQLCGRKLGEFCRGEAIRDVARRMAPWWRP